MILGIAVTFLDLAFELIALAIDHVKIIVSEPSPLFFDLAFDLLPVAFNRQVPSNRSIVSFRPESDCQ